jgi:hypothetical protein
MVPVRHALLFVVVGLALSGPPDARTLRTSGVDAGEGSDELTVGHPVTSCTTR